MKFGLGQFTLQIPPWDERTPAQLYEDTLELAAFAEEAGFGSFWLAEHHGAADDYNPALLPFLSAVAARTRSIEIGTAVMLAPFHHPLRIAEDAAVVDNISGGRLNLGLGLGWAPHEYKMFGVDQKRRGKRLDEFVEVCNRAWTGEPFDYRGEFFDLEGVSVRPAPARKIPIWLGGNEQRALTRAARLGDGHFPPSTAGIEHIPQRGREIVALRAELGVSGPYRYGAFLPVGIGDDADEGWAAIRDGVMHTRGSYLLWSQGRLDVANAREAAAPFDEQVRAAAVCGTPKEVAERLRPVRDEMDALGLHDTFLSVILVPPGMQKERGRGQIERFADVIALVGS